MLNCHTAREFASLSDLLHNLVATNHVLARRQDAVASISYSNNFCECVFEFSTRSGTWFIQKLEELHHDEVIAFLVRLEPRVERLLMREEAPYLLLSDLQVEEFFRVASLQLKLLAGSTS